MFGSTVLSNATRVPLKLIAMPLKKWLTTAAPELIRTSFINGIKEITMCNLKTRNALSVSMMENLIVNINNEAHNKELRAIVISNEGPAYSAGHNLKELANDRQKQETCFKTASQLMNSMIDSPVPIIAKINGIAAAAGCQLVAQCDIGICTENSTFSTPGANFGIFCSTPGVALARCINKMPSLYMLLTGLPVSADDAKQFGLVSKVCPNDKLNEEVDVVCQAIKSKSRDVIELGKKFYYKQIQYDLKRAYEMGGEKMVENLQMPDSKEGINSFIDKRKPQWGCGKS